jgi:hypothetical protein
LFCVLAKVFYSYRLKFELVATQLITSGTHVSQQIRLSWLKLVIDIEVGNDRQEDWQITRGTHVSHRRGLDVLSCLNYQFQMILH